MNEKRITYSLLSTLTALVLSSCMNESASELTADDDAEIRFTTSLPGVTTRSDGTSAKTLDEGFCVTAFDENVETTGTFNPYFSDKSFIKAENTNTWFRSEGCRWPENSGSKDGKLRFFAFYPPLDSMRKIAEGVATDFILTNGSTIKKSGTKYTLTYVYNLTKFKVNKDIKRHIDLVVATQEGTKNANLYAGTNLFFVHPLSRVNVKAFGNSATFDIEIAGVSMGGVYLTGDLKFPTTVLKTTSYTANASYVGSWTITNAVKGRIEYIFENGDKVVQIGSGRHTSASSAVSIMGNGGPAFVVPGTGNVWSAQNTSGRYVSVLLRVKDKSDLLLYPYINGLVTNDGEEKKEMNVVYLSVATNSGAVMRRVYKKDNAFYTSPEYTELYTPEENTEIRDYGWAAIANNFTTSLSTNTTLTIDYSKGIGVEDPNDPYPGMAIISSILPTVSSVEKTPDIDVENFKDGAFWDVSDDLKIE